MIPRSGRARSSPKLPSIDPRRYLHIDGVDRTDLIAKIYQLVIPIAQVIGHLTVPVHPVMTCIEPTWGAAQEPAFRSGQGPLRARGPAPAGGRGIIRMIDESGPLSPACGGAVREAQRRDAAALGPAAAHAVSPHLLLDGHPMGSCATAYGRRPESRSTVMLTKKRMVGGEGLMDQVARATTWSGPISARPMEMWMVS